ncbi:MAG: adenosylcobinamide-GDP ribazoletransferase [Candidatus Latescibacterota bacterium]|nr:MAG: adenosylcobinamide-GDP ribazoletransferase [Candidatus Latescibacterota bacterium]
MFWRDFKSALGFLTVLPLGGGPPSGRAMAAFPLVGGLVGAVLVGARWAFTKFLPRPLCDVLLVGFWEWFTGGLHLDGLADSCDALLPPMPSERRLEVLKDPHIGAFGTFGVVLVLMAKTAGFYLARDWRPIFLAPLLSKWAMVFAAALYPSASEGLGRRFQKDTGTRELTWASVWTVGGVALAGIPGIWASAAVCLFTLSFAKFVLRRVPGFTGDIYGALGELSEVVALTVGVSVGL